MQVASRSLPYLYIEQQTPRAVLFVLPGQRRQWVPRVNILGIDMAKKRVKITKDYAEMIR
jgi:hypothetical protein